MCKYTCKINCYTWNCWVQRTRAFGPWIDTAKSQRTALHCPCSYMCVWSQLVNVSGFSLQAVPVSEAALLHWHLLHLRHPVLRPSRDHHPLLRVPRARALGVGSGPVRAHRAGLPDVWVELRELPCLFIPKGHPASRASHEGELALESTGNLACCFRVEVCPDGEVNWWHACFIGHGNGDRYLSINTLWNATEVVQSYRCWNCYSIWSVIKA